MPIDRQANCTQQLCLQEYPWPVPMARNNRYLPSHEYHYFWCVVSGVTVSRGGGLPATSLAPVRRHLSAILSSPSSAQTAVMAESTAVVRA